MTLILMIMMIYYDLNIRENHKKSRHFSYVEKIVYTFIRFQKNLIFKPLNLVTKISTLHKTLLPYFHLSNKVIRFNIRWTLHVTKV